MYLPFWNCQSSFVQLVQLVSSIYHFPTLNKSLVNKRFNLPFSLLIRIFDQVVDLVHAYLVRHRKYYPFFYDYDFIKLI